MEEIKVDADKRRLIKKSVCSERERLVKPGVTDWRVFNSTS